MFLIGVILIGWLYFQNKNAPPQQNQDEKVREQVIQDSLKKIQQQTQQQTQNTQQQAADTAKKSVNDSSKTNR